VNFRSAIKTLKLVLEKENPPKFSSSWILKFAPHAYRYIQKNVRTETNHIDWDRVTHALDRRFQKRWTRYKVRKVKQYENQQEVDLILQRYREKLYTFIAPLDGRDKKYRDKITVALTLVSQRGNVLAQQELVKWLRYIADEWIDTYPLMYRWKTYPGAVDERIARCITLYRYTGSFLGYLYKTLEYSARALPPTCSFDDPILDGARTKAEYIVAIYDD